MNVLKPGGRVSRDGYIDVPTSEAFILDADLPFLDHDVNSGVVFCQVGQQATRKSCPDAPLRDVYGAGTNLPGTGQPGFRDCCRYAVNNGAG
jgi:hypothetical protein